MTSPLGPVTSCQICSHSPLTSVFFLAFLPPVNTMRVIGTAHNKEEWFPAEMLQCPVCHLVQLGYTADPNSLFPPDYAYTSGTTRILRENFADLYKQTHALLALKPDDLIIDIGSNDGTLLKNFVDGGHRVLGVEPSLTAKLAEEKGVESMMTFFGKESAAQVLKTKGQARVITAANVFAHIHGVNDIVDSIVSLLQPDGVFISESHYLLDLVKTVQYDTIYHEHLRYYSLHSLGFLFQKHGLEIFKVQRIPTHGGSVRVYAARAGTHAVDSSVAALLAEEKEAGLDSEKWIKPFVQNVVDSKLGLYSLLRDIKAKGQSVYAVGAPSRASTLVNYVGLDSGIVDCVVEITGSKKIGKYMPGRDIPVIDEVALYKDQPAYALLLSWHIAEELMPNLKKRGFKGDFIMPLPEPHIVQNSEVTVR